MHRAISSASVEPVGFTADAVSHDENGMVIVVHASIRVGTCPSCGAISQRVHSRYRRQVADLPLSGQRVRMIVVARRFRCDAVRCGTQIFTERFANDVLTCFSGRTARLEGIVHHLGLALGGRPAASFARRLMMPVSNDTLLRVVRRRARAPAGPLHVIDIDDWAWHRNHRYRSIVCNLEARQVRPSLAQRSSGDRDRCPRPRRCLWAGCTPRFAPRRAGADRWHLMENASRAFLDAVRRSMLPIRRAIGAATINPELLTAAERLQYEGYLRREDTNVAILGLAKEGLPIKQIVRRTRRRSRRTRSRLSPYLPAAS